MKKTLALCGATLAVVLALVPGALAAGGTSVTVRVEGLKHTLTIKTVTTHTGWITKDGAPTGKCPAASAAGALDLAAHHQWAGKWYSSFNDYFVTSILGESYSPTSKTVSWNIWVNNKSASTGVCEIALHRGDQVLFAAATYPAYPLGLTAPGSATVGHSFTVKTVWFNAGGKSKPLAGARVTGAGVSVTTNAHGTATIKPRTAGALVLHASRNTGGYVRAAPVTVHVTG